MLRAAAVACSRRWHARWQAWRKHASISNEIFSYAAYMARRKAHTSMKNFWRRSARLWETPAANSNRRLLAPYCNLSNMNCRRVSPYLSSHKNLNWKKAGWRGSRKKNISLTARWHTSLSLQKMAAPQYLPAAS